ncbi:MAG TPA: deoxyribose-phosphate aldolase [Usitatibacteraceae bacterium]|jgi:deoxyribose-phosphate aldolase|nr:deoxyribose-phosphate aldolase [Usitatibacteraceae bacterium]HRA22854.1 deoxyribose-phosphate aldolase [Usitatibacteraceae bacterium]
MKREEMARLLDHSVLKPEAPEADVRAGAELVRGWPGGFYCVQPSWVSLAARMLAGTPVGVISVVGFPHGCDRTEVKARAAQVAVAEGAAEIDMVLNLGLVKSGRAAEAGRDVGEVVRAVAGTPVKVILETAALTPEEIALACRLCVEAGAAFVKTSTGFHPAGGATVEAVRLMRETVGPSVGVKASGGIRSLADAMRMIEAGANRIGTSASAAILAALPG